MLLAPSAVEKLILEVEVRVGLTTSVLTFSTGDDVWVVIGLISLFAVEIVDNCLSTARSICVWWYLTLLLFDKLTITEASSWENDFIF